MRKKKTNSRVMYERLNSAAMFGGGEGSNLWMRSMLPRTSKIREAENQDGRVCIKKGVNWVGGAPKGKVTRFLFFETHGGPKKKCK